MDTYINVDHAPLPITPIDKAWSEDGRVFVRYAECDDTRAHLVGTLADPRFMGKCDILVLATADGQRLPVKVISSTQ